MKQNVIEHYAEYCKYAGKRTFNLTMINVTKLKALTDMPSTSQKRKFQAFLGILNYISK